MTLEASAEYRKEIARLKEKYAGRIRVLCGLERDFIHSPNESFLLDQLFKGMESIALFYEYYDR